MKPKKKKNKTEEVVDKSALDGNESRSPVEQPQNNTTNDVPKEDESKSRPKRSQHVVYRDPLFGIPVANPTPDMIGPVTAAPDPASSPIDRSDSDVITIPTCSQIDCSWNPGHNCCQIDRFAPIEPYVQSSLSENWVSALFALFGNNPLVYVFVKKVFLGAIFWIAIIIWSRFGQDLGILPSTSENEKLVQRNLRVEEDGSDLWSLSQRVLTASDGHEWYEKLTELREEGTKNIKKMLCCLAPYDPMDDNEVIESEATQGMRMQCYSLGRKQGESAFQCISNLWYKVKV